MIDTWQGGEIGKIPASRSCPCLPATRLRDSLPILSLRLMVDRQPAWRTFRTHLRFRSASTPGSSIMEATYTCVFVQYCGGVSHPSPSRYIPLGDACDWRSADRFRREGRVHLLRLQS